MRNNKALEFAEQHNVSLAEIEALKSQVAALQATSQALPAASPSPQATPQVVRPRFYDAGWNKAEFWNGDLTPRKSGYWYYTVMRLRLGELSKGDVIDFDLSCQVSSRHPTISWWRAP